MDTSPLLAAFVADLTWVAFDTEATGYSNVTARLVEVAGVKFRFVRSPNAPGPEPASVPSPEPSLATPGLPPLVPLPPVEILGEFSELVNPGVPIPDDVVKIHGISDAIVRNLPGPVPVLERFFGFCGGATMVAHYVPFDFGAMTYALLREGRGVPRLAAVDTSLLPKRLFPGAPNYALGTLVHFLGLPPSAAHRAMPDALSTLELFRRCVAAIGRPELVTVADVCRLAGPPLTFDQFADVPYALPAELSIVNDAIERHQDLTIEYRGGSKGSVPRRVTPSHLFARDGALFLEAYCHLDQAPKSFRIDRIEKAVLLPVDPTAPLFMNRGSGHWVRQERVASPAPAPAQAPAPSENLP
ncbi:MAG: exonuclease domain-containing protein [Candidatus Eiseniibacteriota bacterium]